jgi:hypothetical protein
MRLRQRGTPLFKMLPRHHKGNKMAEKWIKGAIKHPGKLHRELGVPEGKKIPAKKMAKAAKSKSPTIRKEVALAKTLKKMKK